MDVLLPKIDGFGVCELIRRQSQVPILMLTSSESEFDEVMAMNLGADDYVTKPYRPAVLLAHLQALLRRSTSPAAGMTILHKGVTLNMGAGTVEFQGRTAELTRNELRILQTLMRNPGVVVPRSEIMCALWESDAFIDDNTLIDNNIKLVSAGLKSKIKAIMEVQKCDEATAREELARMSEESGGGDIADFFGDES